MFSRRLSAFSALAGFCALALTGCSSTPSVYHYLEPTEGKTALLRVGGEGDIAVRVVEKDDAQYCFTWVPLRDTDRVLHYLNGVTTDKDVTFPYQGKKAGIPETSATRRYPDKNRWAEFKIPAGKMIELQYSLPYEAIPGAKPKIKLEKGEDMPDDIGAICRAGFRFTPEAGKAYQAAFAWGGMQGDYSCGAVFTTEPGGQIVRMQRLQECNRIDYNRLLKFD